LSVAWAASFTTLAFLWDNVIGAVVVVIAGMIVSLVERAWRTRPSSPPLERER
jgi:hypothetical protein